MFKRRKKKVRLLLFSFLSPFIMNSIASSSKGFHSKKTNHYDSLISNQPQYSYSSPSSSASFRTATTTAYDPELFLGDDCDSSYEATLMQSGLLDWLQTDVDGFPKTSTTQDIFRCCATPRLEMILNHIANSKDEKESSRQ
jgi:hypothetical protein